MMTDPIADMLTRIRNASKAKLEKVDIPSSKLKLEIAKILKDEGYIKNLKMVKDRRQGVIRIYLKYTDEESPVIQGLKRVSRPGCRIYVAIPRSPRSWQGWARRSCPRPAAFRPAGRRRRTMWAVKCSATSGKSAATNRSRELRSHVYVKGW